jgi:hemin uptake protein HemP
VTEPETVYAEGGGTGPSHVRVPSREILRGQREIVILHGSHEYRLRVTRADKLILTK